MAGHELEPPRLEEIRDLLAELVARQHRPPTDVTELAALLGRCRHALTDVLNDRDHLAAIFAETAEELTLWTGTL
ncbi:hypothetical protein [[Kitasatospora] papulosa]|uniref:hypothetical protein n=1 Tax=[Kitasatospora] papulosa TaxID=1464011 RepID=UPI00367A5B16